MLEMRNIMGENHIISENPLELFPRAPGARHLVLNCKYKMNKI